MQTWQQLYSPLGSLGLSALAAVVPIVFFFLALAVFRLKGHVAGSITLALSILVAIFAFQMPVDMAFAAACPWWSWVTSTTPPTASPHS